MSWPNRIALLVRLRPSESDWDGQLRIRIEMKTRENIEAGMQPEGKLATRLCEPSAGRRE